MLTASKNIRQTLLTAIVLLSISSLSGTAFAETPKQCAINYKLLVTGANTTLKGVLRNCYTQADVASCTDAAIANNQAAIQEALSAYEACMLTAVPAGKPQ